MIKDLGDVIFLLIILGFPLWCLGSIESSLDRTATALEKIVKEKEK